MSTSTGNSQHGCSLVSAAERLPAAPQLPRQVGSSPALTMPHREPRFQAFCAGVAGLELPQQQDEPFPTARSERCAPSPRATGSSSRREPH